MGMLWNTASGKALELAKLLMAGCPGLQLMQSESVSSYLGALEFTFEGLLRSCKTQSAELQLKNNVLQVPPQTSTFQLESNALGMLLPHCPAWGEWIQTWKLDYKFLWCVVGFFRVGAEIGSPTPQQKTPRKHFSRLHQWICRPQRTLKIYCYCWGGVTNSHSYPLRACVKTFTRDLKWI